MKQKLMRQTILQLLGEEPVDIKLLRCLKAKDFGFINNDCIELINCDIVLNFLLQRGYVSIKDHIY